MKAYQHSQLFLPPVSVQGVGELPLSHEPSSQLLSLKRKKINKDIKLKLFQNF